MRNNHPLGCLVIGLMLTAVSFLSDPAGFIARLNAPPPPLPPASTEELDRLTSSVRWWQDLIFVGYILDNARTLAGTQQTWSHDLSYAPDAMDAYLALGAPIRPERQGTYMLGWESIDLSAPLVREYRLEYKEDGQPRLVVEVKEMANPSGRSWTRVQRNTEVRGGNFVTDVTEPEIRAAPAAPTRAPAPSGAQILSIFIFFINATLRLSSL